jgi:energy-converting hydrogenase Eha subunit C
MHFSLTGKIHDLIATLTAGSVVAVALSDLDVALKIVVGALTSVFLLLGIVIRARELRSGGGGKKGEGE